MDEMQLLAEPDTERREKFASAVAATNTSIQRPPRTILETGLPFVFLVELAVKILFLRDWCGCRNWPTT
ncbi:hypothetical protein [Massilia cavernae]|uniref:Uncharacterized protein n=1 Tax=Massilia cavernae TaxID=2320864 RepID=A0A418Y8J7_9BURK|nr:hypothetical protein [Massilia cavernae]RJG28094.1 hypothetical protein D3872_00005 [Massilia cavernae]